MTTLVTHDEQLHVYDDLLSAEDLASVWRYVQMEGYRSVHEGGWTKVWRLTDGAPLQGPLTVTASLPELERPGDPGQRARLVPTRTSIDLVFSAVLALAPELRSLVGESGRDWHALAGRAYLYQQGDALSWHSDHDLYVGAWTYYAHPVWHPRWGGELMVADPACRGRNLDGALANLVQWEGTDITDVRRVRIGAHLDTACEAEALESPGIGRWIYPRPNRLVVLAGGHPHAIQRVSPAAGDRVRCSVSGFFVRRRG